MRRKGAISGLLFMGVLIVLGTMGLVYGSWSENLSINGNVRTGNVNVSIASKDVQEDGEKGKEIATCGQSAADTTGDQKADKVTVTILNAFPGYSCHFWTNVINTGTLPVDITATLKGVNPLALSVVRSADIPGDEPGGKKGDCTAQINQGEVEFCDWTVTVLKGALQDSDYTFSVNIDATLINKPSN